MKTYTILILLLALLPTLASGQTGTIKGRVNGPDGPLEFVSVQLNKQTGTVTDANGNFEFVDLPLQAHTLSFSYTGFLEQEQIVILTSDKQLIELETELEPSSILFDQLVVTGTKTFKRQTQSPVIVNVVDSKTLSDVQACNLSEGLRFQPGLRVETDCQTCNYTQLRMNGLGGGYSQILINGRPIFSPLTGLYGMEQIPANMIERIEVVRGGGSALYGSSAIGGTVNVITKIPETNGFQLAYTLQSINEKATDHLISGNATVVNEEGNTGLTLFVNHRDRNWYDHNDDNYSELPRLKNNAFGLNAFFLPKENQKIEFNFSSLNEYRYGGEMTEQAAHLAQQSEERKHDVLIGNIDYQLNFNKDNSSFIAYAAGQRTDRTHYTGVAPDEADEITAFLLNPPYGTSENTTLQAGMQLNHRLSSFAGGQNVLTLGAEYIYDDILDVIPAYNYAVDQLTKNAGFFVQSDWEITPALNLLLGARADDHNLVDQIIVSPRASLLYKYKNTTQFRFSWGTGFRAPQAFDTDLHIAFAGGGISRISLSPNLQEERSNSFSGSVNYDKATDRYVAGFTLEGFHTRLNDAFFLQPVGEDAFGERFEKQNGEGATVKGVTLEVRANYDQKVQLEAGFTLQSSQYEQPVEQFEGVPGKREFLRTPEQYGYATLRLMPAKRFETALNLVYTGSMELAHFGGASNQLNDEYVSSPDFTEISFKSSYQLTEISKGVALDVFGGIKNITNAYQDDFDIGKNRDSNYVYGPGAPRTFFIGLQFSSAKK